MSDLKPCPFCGGENVGTSYKDTFSGDFRRGVYCADCCGGIYPYYDTEAEAIAAWNRRAALTCKNVDEYADHGFFVCGNCGFGKDSIELITNYCPNCGARRVGE